MCLDQGSTPCSSTKIKIKRSQKPANTLFAGFLFGSTPSKNRKTAHSISLYMALHQLWQCNKRKSPLLIKRQEVMEWAKISSSATYHKHLNQLVAYGFLNYVPCFDPANKSEIFFRLLAGRHKTDRV